MILENLREIKKKNPKLFIYDTISFISLSYSASFYYREGEEISKVYSPTFRMDPLPTPITNGHLQTLASSFISLFRVQYHSCKTENFIIVFFPSYSALLCWVGVLSKVHSPTLKMKPLTTSPPLEMDTPIVGLKAHIFQR